MSRLGKLVEQFLRNPPEVRFEDVYYLLTAFGFEEKRSKGSHHIFRNAEGLKITVPKKGGKMAKGSLCQANCYIAEAGGIAQAGQTPEELAVHWLAAAVQHFADDPLEKFIGAFSSNIPDWADQHDRYLGQGLINTGNSENSSNDRVLVQQYTFS